MDLDTAQKEIQLAFDRMSVAYGAVVFDEWAILSGGVHTGILAYVGPRAEAFRRELPDDIEPLRQAGAGHDLCEGDVEFTPCADGKKHDALMKVGRSSYLLCNHTEKTIDVLRANSRWLVTEPILLELSERFHDDPMDE